jgi:polyisoprenoid-binding protein YceI
MAGLRNWGVLAVVVGAFLGGACSGAVEGAPVPGDAPVVTHQRARAEAEPSTIGFAMNKWLEAGGATKASVTGNFTGITVQLDAESRSRIAAGDFAGAIAEVTVDLASLKTGMELRDTNVKEAFFELGTFFDAKISVPGLHATSEPGVYSSKLVLTLRGVTRELPEATLRLVPVDGGYRVQTVTPIVIVNADFGMPVAALLERCHHVGVDPTAEVTVDVFLPTE